GVRRGDVIVVMGKNKPEQRILILAAMYCGAVVFPCNYLSSAEELRRRFKIQKPDVFIVDTWCFEILNDVRGEVPDNKVGICFHSTQIYVIGESKASRISTSAEDAIIMLACSSGTTGPPKITQINSYSVEASLAMLKLSYKPSRSNVLYSMGSMYHISMLHNIPEYLIQGSTFVFTHNPTAHSMLAAIEKYKVKLDMVVTSIFGIPSILVDVINSDVANDYDLTTLNYISVSGASFAEELISRLKTKFQNASIIDEYGMTEAYVLTVANQALLVDGSHGLVAPNTKLKVVDCDTGNNLGPGQYGELRFKGPQIISKGYLGNEEANKALFDDDNWLRTGDYGCYDNDGNVYVRGRIKHLIKYNGIVVIPTELEFELHKHPQIDDVAVIGVTGVVGYEGEVPKAFIVARVGNDLNEEDVHRYMKGRLSDYKQLHGGVEFMKGLPKLSKGKIMRQKLKRLSDTVTTQPL
uniref:AMP-dependent synthetase/ligase domain-containing protein n=1 Tax=Ciona intestinalis TaxID=7719 RepID=F6WTW9_CIOIN